MHISVYPPMGRVRVAAPHRIDEDTIRRAITQRVPWIKKERERFQKATRQTRREMISGESHYVWGKRYLLDVSKHSGVPKIELSGNTLWVYSPKDSSPEDRFKILDRWYRREIKKELPRLISKWEPKIGVKADKIQVRRMKTKWGTCNPDSASLWFNPELAKKNPRCLEYIVVHELTHLLERKHNARFMEFMDRFLPDWESRQEELNEAPLADENW
ncbi:SprT family zinc-dependent metalloprotease [Corynebacterium sp. sy017]|uniref:M48 family metallopeptidase n=1 Tax=unclassified Corynebacterium TaxID=2624378 RepID=UPI0032C05667